jgi:hypothetical protein
VVGETTGAVVARCPAPRQLIDLEDDDGRPPSLANVRNDGTNLRRAQVDFAAVDPMD